MKENLKEHEKKKRAKKIDGILDMYVAKLILIWIISKRTCIYA